MWGKWPEIARKFANRRGAHMVRWLARKPGDFLGAFRKLPAKERAIHVFAYQSHIWNDSVQRFLREVVPRARLLVSSTVAGTIVFPSFPEGAESVALPETFPLVSDLSKLEDPRVEKAVKAALAAEGLTLERFKIDGIPGCFFKHEERPLLLRPERLVIAEGPKPDDRFEGRLALTMSFRLPPGGYATMVLKRLVEAVPLAAPTPRAHRRPSGRSRGRGPRR
jgi:tRNA pseudouridine13 synthase